MLDSVCCCDIKPQDADAVAGKLRIACWACCTRLVRRSKQASSPSAAALRMLWPGQQPFLSTVCQCFCTQQSLRLMWCCPACCSTAAMLPSCTGLMSADKRACTSCRTHEPGRTKTHPDESNKRQEQQCCCEIQVEDP